MRAWLVSLAVVVLTACSAGTDRPGGPRPMDAGIIVGDAGGTIVTDAGACGAGMLLCGSACSDVSRDRMNCGMCGRACAASEVCSLGTCSTSCSGTESMRCGDICVDLNTNPSHCGACDMPCASPLFCGDGRCMASCDEFGDRCGDVCTDLTSDPLNCGMCGNACPDLPHASPTCIMSTCGYTCDVGYADCNGLAPDGCEVTLATDIMHCGSCPTVCPTPAHSSPTCIDGACGFVCDIGWENCNGDPVDGCEADLTLPTSCGSCTPCATGETCVGGMCRAGGGCYAGPARILAYGPGQGATTSGTDLIAAGGAIVTVASEAMWMTMTTADFGNYDIIWLDGSACGSDTAATVYGTAQDTVAVWGPAITGRIELMIGDPDYHAETWSNIFYTNSAGWLKQTGRNADGGRTSLFINWGCNVFNSNSMGMVPGRGTPESFTGVLGAPFMTDTTNFCGATTTAAGLAHPVLVGMTSYWSCAMHGGFSTMPASYVALSTGTPGGSPTVIVRDTTPCTP